MNDMDKNELSRIVEMVEGGKVTPEEGERLIDSMTCRVQTMTCPYCAERIPAGAGVCPECATTLDQAPSELAGTQTRLHAFHALPRTGKFLVIYMFVVCTIVLLAGSGWGLSLHDIVPAVLAGLGIVSAVLLCKGRPLGWSLAILWAALQVPVISVNDVELNNQIFGFDITQTTNGTSIGLDVVGVVLLIIAIVARNRAMEKQTRLAPVS